MKAPKKVSIAFAAGLLLGLVPSAIAYFNNQWLTGFYSSVALAEMSVNASQLKKGRTDEVLGRYEQSIPTAIVTVHSNFMNAREAKTALWAAQKYYEENPAATLPADARQILASLPPNPQRGTKTSRDSEK